MLLGEIARRNSRRYPTKTAVIHDGTAITWAQLDDRANRLGNYLLSCGLRPGDAVAIAAQNTLQWPEMAYGLAKAGLILVPLNIRLTAAEVSYIVADAGCRAAIVHTEQVASIGPALTELETRLEIGGADFGVSYEAALASSKGTDPTPRTLTETDVYSLLYTSGTTGRPKGVINEHRGLLAQVVDTSISTEARHDDVMLSITPFFTAGGMIRTLSWMYLGQTMVIHTKFDPDATLDAIERHRVTMTTFIPTMLMRTMRALEDGPARDVSSLRRISYGSAPSPTGLAREAMERLGCDLQQRYGCTEAGGQVTILTPEDHRAMVAGNASLATSCGRETPHADLRICDQDGNELPPGEIGELVIRADSVARGYWNQPEATAATFRADGLWSGDLASRDADGYIHISGRKTDMIISGGFNVYPAEIERVIGQHPNVDLVAVVGAPHQEWGETPVAVIVAKGDIASLDLEGQLRDLCRQELAGYKQPRAFEFRSELPLGPAGKVLKREIKADLATPSS